MQKQGGDVSFARFGFLGRTHFLGKINKTAIA
jgi:hypothetical protein